MDRKQAEREVKSRLKEYLRSIGINPDKQFRCLNPEHPDKKPSMGIMKGRDGLPRCHCLSCNVTYSTFDVIGLQYGLTETKDIFKKGYELFHIEIDGNQKTAGSKRKEAAVMPKQEAVNQNTQSTIHNKPYILDLTEEAEAAHADLMKNVPALSYITNTRGIEASLIDEYKLGYDAEGYNHFMRNHPEHQNKGSKVSLYRIFFPYWDENGKCVYVLSEINDRKKMDDYNGKYRKIDKGETELEAPIFNERYLKKDSPSVIFLCEGIYDALSIESAGGKAIAFSGIGHRRFLSLCEKHKPRATFIIGLDADGAGSEAANKIKEGLDKMGIPYKVKPTEEADCKDYNDALKKNKEAFRSFVEEIIKEADTEARQAEEEEREAYMETSAGRYLSTFFDEILAETDRTFFPTGFEAVDAALDGGLYPGGLYFIGAMSSLGKTTFALQVMDNIAAAGNDALIFSLEMARKELMAKSISRHSMKTSIDNFNGVNRAKTVRGILTGSRYASYSKEDRDNIDLAFMEYAQYAERVFIHEGIGDIGVNQIRETIDRHIRLTGRKPVVLIDYVQILAPYNDRATDKQNTDKAVLELKRMSRDFQIPIIGISSFNRESYTEPVTMAAFKESGAIEYSCDTLIALQYNGMDYKDGDEEEENPKPEKKEQRTARVRKLIKDQIKKAKNGEAQEIQFKILKNRNGSKGSVLLSYYPMFNRFTNYEAPEGGGGTETVAGELDIPY